MNDQEWRLALVRKRQSKRASVVSTTPELALRFFGMDQADYWRLTEVGRTRCGIYYDVNLAEPNGE